VCTRPTDICWRLSWLRPWPRPPSWSRPSSPRRGPTSSRAWSGRLPAT